MFAGDTVTVAKKLDETAQQAEGYSIKRCHYDDEEDFCDTSQQVSLQYLKQVALQLALNENPDDLYVMYKHGDDVYTLYGISRNDVTKSTPLAQKALYDVCQQIAQRKRQEYKNTIKRKYKNRLESNVISRLKPILILSAPFYLYGLYNVGGWLKRQLTS